MIRDDFVQGYIVASMRRTENTESLNRRWDRVTAEERVEVRRRKEIIAKGNKKS